MSDQNPSAWPDPTAASGPSAPSPFPAPAPLPPPTMLEPGPAFTPGQASPAYPAPEPVSAGYAPMDQPAGDFAAPGYPPPGYAPQSGYPASPGYPAQPGYPASPGYPAQPGYPAPAGAVPGYGAPGYPPGYAVPGYPGYAVAMPKPTNGLAIGSMVVSLVAVAGLCFYGIGGLLGIVGAILGHVSKRQILERDQNGEGMAKAGIIVGWIATGLGVLVLAAFIVLIVLAANADPTYSGDADF